jgi:predicted phosphodiesterase
MRLLVFSDIHNNLDAVRKLRKKEDNVYDALIVAGDIGSESADDFFQILDTFNCPSYCVYGNWNGDLTYRRKLSEKARLIHHNVARIGDYFVTGFSGCPTNWGKNPIWLEESRLCLSRHQKHLEDRKRMLEAVSQDRRQIEEKSDGKIAELELSTTDKRRIVYQSKLAKLLAKRDREMSRACKLFEQLNRSQAHRAYQRDASKTWEFVLRENRNRMMSAIVERKLPHKKVIIVTHERLYRLLDDAVSPLLHIFGHRHSHQFNKHLGTLYLNAAAIDLGIGAVPWLNLKNQGYCILEVGHSTVTMERRRLVGRPLPKSKRVKTIKIR